MMKPVSVWKMDGRVSGQEIMRAREMERNFNHSNDFKVAIARE